MKRLVIVAALTLLGTLAAHAEEATGENKDRQPASQESVFSQDYLESVQDEQAQALAQSEQDRKEHEKYLKYIDRHR
jgi:hypothetical protein